MAKARNGHRGVVLRLDDAAAIHRWLECIEDGRKFYNPIEAVEARKAMEAAKARLGVKVKLAQFSTGADHGE